MDESVGLSIVIPVFNSSQTIGCLVRDLGSLKISGGLEIILVNDGSTDNSQQVCEELARTSLVPVTVIEHTKNYGEHNAVMSGFRLVNGRYVITMDDDFQNPPDEIPRLYESIQKQDKDVIYCDYNVKQNVWWRNWGSWLAEKTANAVLDKPKDLYWSSFRCVKRFVVDEIARDRGPFPYIDGLIFQITNNISFINAQHHSRRIGKSHYSLSRLIRLWSSIVVNFSVRPLRLGIFFGAGLICIGALGLLSIFSELFFLDIVSREGNLLITVGFLIAGGQFLMLGLVGEYIGRTYLAIGKKPQSIVRKVLRPKKENSSYSGNE
jgi:undecaprenyl-phosphate 4-deoxy-4-formamido-L-arabinose transferase